MKKFDGRPHPWRVCPLGSNFVKEHTRKTKNGLITVAAHCRRDRISREVLNLDEIQEMFQRNEDLVTSIPKGNNLGFTSGNAYDVLIGLWTQFWNEIYQTNPPLDPNWVKALIATESSFNPNAHLKTARGLMQITESTYKILINTKGELKDVVFRIDQKDLFIADVSISVGTRWLFHKRKLLQNKIGRDPDWEEVMWEYKGIYNDNSEKGIEIKGNLRKFHEKIINL
jgi:hypothetical protein